MFRSIVEDHGIVLSFVFYALNDDIMPSINIHKPIPNPLDVLKVDNAFSYRVGHTTRVLNVY